ncbi:zinc finger protein 385D-like [Menidia menidia]
MDRIHKALISPGLGLSSPLKRKATSCAVCRLRFNSEAQASSHYSGTRHAKRLKALDPPDSKTRTSEPVAKETASQILSSPRLQAETTSEEPSAPSIPEPFEAPKERSDFSLPVSPGSAEKGKEKEDETEEEKAVRLLYCSLCKVAVNSASQLQAHNSGTKHKTMLEARSGDGAIKSFPRMGVKAKTVAPSEPSTGLQNKTFFCEICDVHVNSETQLKQHISSRRHKDRAAGKPAKPKFSPYAPPPAGRESPLSLRVCVCVCVIRLTLRKSQNLSKPLASCLLQRHLSAAAAMATMPAFPLTPAAPPLFHSQALLHPAPPPICSAHTPVLFAPY